MEGIRIEVTGNVARVIEKPDKITSGTIGLPVEFTFDSQWDGLTKVAVFRAGHEKKTVPNPEAGTTVPWELLDKPHSRLGVGVFGANKDGTVAIPTIWANVAVVQVGVDPEGDPTTDPTLPIWQVVLDEIDNVHERIDDIALEYAPIPDWNQEDPDGPGYIKNKPDLSEIEQVVENTAAIETISRQVSENATAIGNISEQVSDNATSIENINEQVSENTTNISNIQADLGDMDTALDSIIAMQEAIIGGESV